MANKTVAAVCAAAALLAACTTADTPEAPSDLQFANLLAMTDSAGTVRATVCSPWPSQPVLGEYILTECRDSLPVNSTAEVIQVPVGRALVFSNVHVSLIHELGGAGVIAGVCDGSFITDSLIAERIRNGEVADCGPNTEPDLEKIAAFAPDVILVSPYAEADAVIQRLRRLNVPIVVCADYLEDTPLARAEWMRFYGRLIGRAAAADSLFASVQNRYEALSARARESADRPAVLIDTRYGDIWYVPTENTTTHRFIVDAGGANPFASFGSGESAGLSVEQVLATAQNADKWLVRYYSPVDLSLAQFAAQSPENAWFAPVSQRQVYGCNTAASSYYDRVPFHPDELLANMMDIFHPEMNIADSITFTPFFRPLE